MSQLTPIPATVLERTLGMPAKGPKSCAVALDFATSQTWDLDYSNLGARGFLDMVQSMWVDNSLSGAVLTITIPGSNQTIKYPANTQGYITVLVPNPIKISFSSTGGVAVQVILLNFPVRY